MSGIPASPLPVVGSTIGPLWASMINTALAELQSVVGDLLSTGSRSVKFYGAVGDGTTDDTAAIQSAIDNNAGLAIFFPRGKYRVTSTIHITSPAHSLIGDYGIRNVAGGTEIAYSGTGPLFEIGTDNGHAWDANDYDGPQDQHFENIWFSHSNPDTGLTLDGTQEYKAGAYGIRDWRGGGILISNCGFERFEYNFWGVQSDINHFTNVTSLYSKYGIYLGPRSDQCRIEFLYSFFCDQALTIDRASSPRIVDAQIVGCGNATNYPIEIRRGSTGVRLVRPWLEHLDNQGYTGTDQVGFIGAGLTDGYGATSSSARAIYVEDPLVYTTITGAVGHSKCIIGLGKATDVRLMRPTIPQGSSLTNFDALVIAPAGTNFSNADAEIRIEGIGSLTQTKAYTNSGTGAPDVFILMDSSGGRRSVNSVGRHIFEAYGGTAGTEITLSAEGQVGQVWLIEAGYTGGQTARLKLWHALQHANAAPSSGTWELGDIVLNAAGGTVGIGWVCTVAGTPGTFAEWGRLVPLATAIVKSANYNVTVGDAVLVASGGGGALTFTLPASPIANQRIEFGNSNGAFTLTLGRNGNNINGAAADLVIAANKGAVIYWVPASGWFTVGMV